MTIEDAVLDYYRRGMAARLEALDGEPLQDFFAAVMELTHKDFIRVVPWGNVGDLKCDGYLPSNRSVFQVYSPLREEARKTNAKITADFNGACEHWRAHMDRWVFVNNAQETPAPVLLHFQSLDVPEGVKTELWPSGRLVDLVSRIEPDDLARLLGPPPSMPGYSTVAFDDVQAVLRHLAAQIDRTAQLAVTDMDLREPSPEKLAANALSPSRQRDIALSLTYARAVEMALENVVDPTQADRIVGGFREHYLELRASGAFTPDDIYDRLRHFAGGWGRGSATHEQAINAVIAHLFEKCSIFERPGVAS